MSEVFIFVLWAVAVFLAYDSERMDTALIILALAAIIHIAVAS